MRRSLLAIFAVILAVGVPSRRAQADFIVTVGSTPTPIDEGGTGFVDVMIRSDGPTALPLASFGFQFNITAVGNAHTLEFVDLQPQDQARPAMPPTAAYLTSYLIDPNYVFFGNSSNFDNTFAVGKVRSTGAGTNDQYDGGDSTFLNMGADVMVPTTDVLLIRLSLTAALDAMPVAGDSFMVTLTPAGTAFQTQGDLDTGDREPYTTTPGLVTISLRSVPEPGSILLLSLGIPAAGWMLRRRTRRAA